MDTIFSNHSAPITRPDGAAASHDTADLAAGIGLVEIWNGLVGGSLQLLDGWCSSQEAGLLLERCRRSRAPVPWQHAEVLRRVLAGESQKCVGAATGTSTATVATRCTDALEMMGRRCPSSRAPVLLLLAANAASGRPMPPVRVHRTTVDDVEHLTVSAACPKPTQECGLTAAEQVVFGMFIAGRTYAQIAQVCDKSVRTVANQLAAAHRKVGEAGRAAALGRILRAGIDPSKGNSPAGSTPCAA